VRFESGGGGPGVGGVGGVGDGPGCLQKALKSVCVHPAALSTATWSPMQTKHSEGLVRLPQRLISTVLQVDASAGANAAVPSASSVSIAATVSGMRAQACRRAGVGPGGHYTAAMGSGQGLWRGRPSPFFLSTKNIHTHVHTTLSATSIYGANVCKWALCTTTSF
jgi:hypothetical protein